MERIDNWFVTTRPISPYQAPEQCGACIAGRVYNRPLGKGEGHHIVTSYLVGFDGKVIQTQNSRYELGTIDPEYNRKYPDAREQLLKTFGAQAAGVA